MISKLKTLRWAIKTAYKIDKKMLILWLVINCFLSVFPAMILVLNREVIATITNFINGGNGQYNDIVENIIIMGLLMTVSGLSNRINADLLYMVMYDSYYLGMQELLMNKIQKIPFKVLKQQEIQEEYIAIINRAGSLTDVISSMCILCGRCFTVVSILTVVLQQSAGSFIIIALYILLTIFASNKYIDKQRINMLEIRKEENIADYFQKLPLELGVAKEIRIYDSSSEILQQWGIAYEKIAKHQKEIAWGKEQRSFLNGAGLYIFILILCSYQIFLVATGKMTADGFLTIFLLCQNLTNTIRDLTNSMIQMDYGLFSLKRQRSFIEKVTEEKKNEIQICEVEKKDCIVELKDIEFSYDKKKIINHLNLELNRGEVIALVGENGSGKSTLAKLLIGQLEPDAGSIKYFGKKSMRELKRSIGIYFQDFFLFHMTLKENIEIGDIQNINNKEMMENAVEFSSIGSLLESFKKGMNQMLKKDIDKDGRVLSGGEQQKVGIARAVYGTKELMIFDEPAAALDPIAEIEQFEKIRSAIKNKTAILISHRIGFARLADKILVLKDGTIVESGDHKTLIDRRGLYYEYFKQQGQWYAKTSESEKKHIL